ncbi:hypothetical protein [Pseudomonas sp. 25 E 4]|nr:hypothetical protein [Pseudomonas sp. 25 E 4]
MPGAHAFHGHGFPAHMHLAQVAQRAPLRSALLGEQIPVSGGQVGQGHALVDDFPRQLPGVPELVAAHDQCRARAQRRVALLDKAVEAERGKLQHAVFFTQLAVAVGTVAELTEGGVINGHALGLTSGARGVDHIGEVGGLRMVGRIG